MNGGNNRHQSLLADLHSHLEGSDGMGVDEVDSFALHQLLHFIDQSLVAIVNIKVIHWPSKTDPLALV